MKVVFDNNVLISAALLKDSIPYKAFRKAIESYTILRSHSLLDELKNTIYKEKFDRYFKEKYSRDSFFVAFVAASVHVDIKEKLAICRDPKDNMYLELARSGEAFFIVTGDMDLLVLNPFFDINILSPRAFLEQ